jgi:hypothetical protein
MSILQTVIGAIVSSGGGAPTPTYQLYLGGSNNVNEGSAQTFNAAGTNIANGTYYWTVETNAGDFATTSGEFTITDNSGSFTVTPTADLTTEGAESFTVALRSGSITGPILATSDTATINDTSLAPVPPFSLEFNQPQGDFLSTPASNDWNLGTTGTIEFWIKANNATGANINIPGGQWGLINQGGWYYGMPDNNCILIGLAGSKLSIAQSNTDDVQYTEPTAGVWTHVAVVYNAGTQKVYYNGVEQTKTSGNYLGNGWTNTTSDLYIGRLAPNYASHFDGKMALVRISNTAKYTAAFTPSKTYGVESDTRMMLGSDNPLTDLALYELNGITTSAASSIGNNGLLYFSKATYPDLNNQVRSGDTVVDATTAATSTVIGAVFAPNGDPDNWGITISSIQQVGTKNFSGPGRHPIDNQGAVISTDFPTIPQTFVALAYTQNNGYATNYGGNQISVLVADYPTIGNVPNGATVTITGQGSGTFTVDGSYVQSGLRFFTVGTLDFTAWGSDTLTFNWNA